jgi:hypothetical protein
VPSLYIKHPQQANHSGSWTTVVSGKDEHLKTGAAIAWAFLPYVGGRFVGCQHAKFLQVSKITTGLKKIVLTCPLHKIFYSDGRMRLAIASANFVSYDWEFIDNVSIFS